MPSKRRLCSFSTFTEGVDYILAPDTVALSSAVRTAVIGVSTVDDSLLEGGEFFVASLTYGGPLLGVDLSPRQATVTIEDAEGEGYMLICMLVTKDLRPSFKAGHPGVPCFHVCLSGLWLSGLWLSGLWLSGLWLSGLWLYGLWLSGLWLYGLWLGYLTFIFFPFFISQ